MAYRDYPRNGGRNADQPIGIYFAKIGSVHAYNHKVHDSIGISASQRTPTRESSRREPNPGSVSTLLERMGLIMLMHEFHRTEAQLRNM